MRIYVMIFMFVFCSLGICHAHELGTKHKRIINDELIKERVKYDKCLKKAEDDITVELADAQKLCRRQYAKNRHFSVQEIFHLYTEHTILADELYTELLVSVSGVVHRIGTTALGFPEVIFHMDDFGLTGMRCEFPKSMADTINKLKIGEELSLIGISKGLFNDDYVRIAHAELLD